MIGKVINVQQIGAQQGFRTRTVIGNIPVSNRCLQVPAWQLTFRIYKHCKGTVRYRVKYGVSARIRDKTRSGVTIVSTTFEVSSLVDLATQVVVGSI